MCRPRRRGRRIDPRACRPFPSPRLRGEGGQRPDEGRFCFQAPPSDVQSAHPDVRGLFGSPPLRSPLTRLRHPLPAAQGEGMEYAHRFDPHAPRHFPADAICSLLPACGEKVAGGRMRGAFAVALRAPRELSRALLLPGLRTPPPLRSPLTRLRHPLPAAQGEGMRTWPLLARSSQRTTSTALAGSSLLPACGEKVAGGRMRGALHAEPSALRHRRTLTADRDATIPTPFAPHAPVGHPLPALQGEGNSA